MAVAKRPPQLRVIEEQAVDLFLPETPWKVGVPANWGECEKFHRDRYTRCPYIACRFHLDLVASSDMPGRRTPGKQKPASTIRPTPTGESCALDLSEQGAMTAAAIAEHFNVTPRRIQQEVKEALEKCRAAGVTVEMLEALAQEMRVKGRAR